MAILLSKKVLLNSSFLPTTTKVGCSVPLLKSAKVAALNNQASKQFLMMTLGAHVASVHHLVAHLGLRIGAQTLSEKGQL
jgi:hypothetical protein